MILIKHMDKDGRVTHLNLDAVATMETRPGDDKYVVFRLNSGNTIELETTLDEIMEALKTATR
jgi:hypothetical protein